MSVAANITIPWPSTDASIPSGWTRVTALDRQFLRGASSGADPGTTGGSSIHVHDTAHAHDLDAHTHASASVFDSQGTLIANNVGGAAQPAATNHSHSWPTLTAGAGGPETSTGTTSGTGAWVDQPNAPQSWNVIWIKSDGTPAGIPPLGLAYWTSATIPVGFVRPGTAKGSYLQGAIGVDGGTTFGSNTHAHEGGIHGHTWAGSHTHTYTVTGSPATSGTATIGGDGTVAVGPGTSSLVSHTHVLTTGSASSLIDSVGSTPSMTTATAASEPPYYTLAVIQNGSTLPKLPPAVIACWQGTLATIPSGWTLCDGGSGTPDLRDQFVKGANLLTDIGHTGGGGGHSHTGPTHSHTITHHSVFDTGAETDGGTAASGSGGNVMAAATHTHQFQSSSEGGSDTSLPNDAITDSTLPTYTTTAYIQYTATGGTISVTTPAAASIQALPSFTAVWTLSGGRTQASYEVVIYQSDGVTVVYDSGSVTSSSQTALIPSGYLTNNGSWKFAVTATDSDGLISTSSPVSFTTAWAEPAAATGLTVTPVGGT